MNLAAAACSVADGSAFFVEAIEFYLGGANLVGESGESFSIHVGHFDLDHALGWRVLIISLEPDPLDIRIHVLGELLEFCSEILAFTAEGVELKLSGTTFTDEFADYLILCFF